MGRIDISRSNQIRATVSRDGGGIFRLAQLVGTVDFYVPQCLPT